MGTPGTRGAGPGCARRQRAARHSPWPILRPVSWQEAAMTEGSEYRAPGVSRAQLRVSTMDRDRAVEVLAKAYTEGRLTKDEHDARVGQAITASTFADLDAVVADLPSYRP